MILTIFAALLVYAFADYLLQADQHGWDAPFALDASGRKWGWLDFIPHDSWHAVQFVKNRMPCLAVFAALGAFAAPPWYVYLLVEATYATTRFFAFTVPMWLYMPHTRPWSDS